MLFGGLIQTDMAESPSVGTHCTQRVDSFPAALLSPEELPLPMGVQAESGD